MKFRVMLMTGLLPLGLGLAGCAAIGEKPESEAAAELLPPLPSRKRRRLPPLMSPGWRKRSNRMISQSSRR